MRKVREQEPEGFAEFWAEWMPVCRDSDGRPKARKAYLDHILRGASPEDILLAARWHIRDRREKKTLPYIQLASSWLNAERYEFEAPRERAYQARMAERAVQPQPKPLEPVVNTMTKEEREAAQRRIFEKFGMAGELH